MDPLGLGASATAQSLPFHSSISACGLVPWKSWVVPTAQYFDRCTQLAPLRKFSALSVFAEGTSDQDLPFQFSTMVEARFCRQAERGGEVRRR
jgi:hypothetical protein